MAEDRPIVARATHEETEEIKRLFTRKAALRELVLAMAKMSPQESQDIYERVVNDLAATCYAFDQWWLEAAEKHHLEGQMVIDFQTGAIRER